MSDERVDCAYQEVTCADCGRTYQCTSFDDYYNSTTLLYRNRDKFAAATSGDAIAGAE